jgi:uncharacterized membrane protein (UPF0127 family)
VKSEILPSPNIITDDKTVTEVVSPVKPTREDPCTPGVSEWVITVGKLQ